MDCLICKEVLDEPVQLICEGNHIFCAPCIAEWVQNSPSCPICRKSITETSVLSVPTHFINLLSDLKISCDYSWKGCQNVVALGELQHHVEKCCVKDLPVPVMLEHNYALPSTMEDKTHVPLVTQTPPPQLLSHQSPKKAIEVLLSTHNLEATPGFEQLATKCVKRKLQMTHDSRKGAPVRFKTKGGPFHMTYVPVPSKESVNASKHTKKVRARYIEKQRKTISGSNESNIVQMNTELKRTSGRAFKPSSDVPEGAGLVLKSDLAIPWNKLRKLRRWLKRWKVEFPSEGKDRLEAKNLLDGIRINAVEILLHFNVRNPITGRLGTECRMTPSVAVSSPKDVCIKYLHELERCNKLTWHGIIPENEVWVKVGGDKGGEFMKTCLEVCNVNHPNSIDNTIIINMFRANDNYKNLEITTKELMAEVSSLDGLLWRDFSIKVYVMGDYEYLTKLYGLSGPCGKYFCLWCHTTKDICSLFPETRPSVDARTLESIIADHDKFKEDGGSLRKAKEYHNCIHSPLIGIPTERVALPGLHISLGVYLMFFRMLETDCVELDRKIFMTLSKTGEVDEPIILPANFNSYIETIEQILKLLSESEDLRDQAECIETELVAFEHLDEDDKDDIPLREVNRLQEEMEELLHSADEKPANVEKICYTPVTTVRNVCPEFLEDAENLYDKYQPLLTFFSNCHNIYSVSRELTENEITCLRTSIRGLFMYLRVNFPHVSITPKLHMLEEHVLPQIEKYRVGLGFLGENGVEAIHHKINESVRNYSNNRDADDILSNIHQCGSAKGGSAIQY
ncbi:uncharacterized protein LOC144451311 [Glandiceps talaboti]